MAHTSSHSLTNGSSTSAKHFSCPWCPFEGPCGEHFKVHLGSHLSIQPPPFPLPSLSSSQPLTSQSSCACPHKVGCPFFKSTSFSSLPRPKKSKVAAAAATAAHPQINDHGNGCMETENGKIVADASDHKYDDGDEDDKAPSSTTVQMEKPFACLDCDYRTTNPRNLKRHINRKHSGIKIYKRPSMELNSKSDLNKTDGDDHDDDEGVKSYECSFEGCNYAGVSLGSLHNHWRVHNKRKSVEDEGAGHTKKSLDGVKSHEKKRKLQISTKFLFPQKPADAAATAKVTPFAYGAPAVAVATPTKVADALSPTSQNEAYQHQEEEEEEEVSKMAFCCKSKNCGFVTVDQQKLAIHSNEAHQLPKIRLASQLPNSGPDECVIAYVGPGPGPSNFRRTSKHLTSRKRPSMTKSKSNWAV